MTPRAPCRGAVDVLTNIGERLLAPAEGSDRLPML